MIRIKFGAEIVPYYSPKKLSKLGLKLEKAGFDYLWVTDHYHYRFVHSILAHLAETTENIQLGPGVTNPYLIHPAVTAAAIATLDELSGGRAALGISAGDPTFLNSVGIKHDRPITAVSEAIHIIRGLLNGEKLEFSGDMFTCRGAKLRFFPLHEIPTYVGGRREYMMKLAGAVADGALFNAAHLRDLEECIEFVERGAKERNRDLGDFDMVAYMATSVDENEEKARKEARTVTSFIAASAPESTVEREGLSKNRIKNMRKHLMRGNIRKARGEVTEKMVDIFTVSGSMEKLEGRIEELRKMGITQTVIGSPIGPDTESAIKKIMKIID